MGRRDSLFVRACLGRDVERHPIWFMRQAGRYLPKYREIKGNMNILDLQMNPELSSDITVLPVRELGVDAAILYSDIMVPVRAAGYNVRIEEDVGPVVDTGISENDVGLMHEFECKSDAPYVIDNITLTRSKLDDDIPIIGFSAGPFTMLSYLFEGRPSRTFERCRDVAKNDPDLWDEAMRGAVDLISEYLNAQIGAGVDAVQIFDSWAGLLGPDFYSRYVKMYTKMVFSSLPDGIPKIHFSAKNSFMLRDFADTGCNVMSLDHDTDLRTAMEYLGNSMAIQGNLSPDIARIGGNEMRIATERILDGMRGVSRFVFNLGHGVLRDTDPENLKQVVRMVKCRGISD